jgi:hypothetical protein
MASKKPLVLSNTGSIQEIMSGDIIDPSLILSPFSTIVDTLDITFSSEDNTAIVTVPSSLTAGGLLSFTYVPIETTATSLDDFTLNAVTFNIENIIDNVSFDIRANALNNATGTYTILYKIIYL